MAGKFELCKAKNGKLFFCLKASNGQTILSSEMYEKRASATNGIKSVKKNSTNEKCIERKKARNGKNYFVLKSTNGQVIGQSQQYASAASMEKGIASVQRNAADAEVKDMTS
ncbi:MAG: YegP family protein [Pyrinomonadaceae bacterium]